MQPAKPSRVNNLALSLGLSLLSATALNCFAPQGTQLALANDNKAKVAIPAKDETIKVGVPARDQAAEESAYEERERLRAVALQQLQNDAIQHYEASRVYFDSGNMELSELEIQAAIMDTPEVKIYHRDYCVVSLLRGEPMRALAEAIMVIGLGDPVSLTEKQIDKLKDKGCKLHYRRGIELAAKKNWRDAITEFNWALQYRPNTAAVIRSMAFANANLGNIELAEKQYGSSFSADPHDAYGHADLAYILAESGKGTEAIEQLQEAVKLQPKVAALHIDLGWMAESKGNLNEAEGEFAQAVKLSPRHASLWTHLGKLLAKDGKAEQAAQAYKTAISLDPSATDARDALHSLSPAASPAGKGGTGAGESEDKDDQAGKAVAPGKHIEQSENTDSDGHAAGAGGKNAQPPKYSINRQA